MPLRAFEAGCDDFLGKPCATSSYARVAILRRTKCGTTPRRVGALVVDPHRLEARYTAAGVRVSDKEARVSDHDPLWAEFELDGT